MVNSRKVHKSVLHFELLLTSTKDCRAISSEVPI